MKNIHILPTDKPSRLYLTTYEYIFEKGYSLSTDECENKHIYITSDEEIKEGDWFLENSTKLLKWKMTYSFPSEMNDVCKKIILTTDQDLIKDGIQAIDDDFLEWFVENPNCEEVKINYEIYKKAVGLITSDWRISKDDKYKIVIPKEEPKQETLTNDTDSHSWGFENFEVIKTEEDVKIFVETMENIPEPNDKLKKAFIDFNKQETLEEAAAEFAKNHSIYPTAQDDTEYGFIAGAKWQQEQDKKMYSEEEVKHLMTLAFEQGFKKADVVEAGLEAKETDTEVNWIFLKHKK